jgi:urease accessory protein
VGVGYTLSAHIAHPHPAAATFPARGREGWPQRHILYPTLAAARGENQRDDRPLTDAPPMQRARGEGRITTQVRDGHTHVAELFQEGAAKIRLPNTHDRSLQAVLMNTAGGLTGGDRMSWRAEACERIYRSLGTDATVTTGLTAGPGARIDWLPQETILFEGSRLNRRIEIDLAQDATLLAVEAVLLGREAMGEAAMSARLADNWRVRRAGRLIHAEATRLSADPRERENLSLLAGALAFATILYVGADAPRKLETIRALPDRPTIGSSVIGDRLIVRATAASGLALRRGIVPIIATLSGDGALPRLWNM